MNQNGMNFLSQNQFQNNQSNELVIVNFVIHKPHGTYLFQIPNYYKIIGIKGQGAYGIVLAAQDSRTGKLVAIKKIKNIFEQNKVYQKRILREVKILQLFAKKTQSDMSDEDDEEDDDESNVLQLLDIIPTNKQTFQDVYTVTPLMDFDLTRITGVRKRPTERMVKYILRQILNGVNQLHNVGIVHRDIKPQNILVDKSLSIKICDFGLSRGIREGDDASETYVVTRCYRSPELCLGWSKSSFACDIWSVGCIFAELLGEVPNCFGGGNKILFPGESNTDQIYKIFLILGLPNDFSKVKGSPNALNWVKNHIPFNCQKFSIFKIFSHASKDAMDLLLKMLTIDPLERITATEALKHPYFSDFNQDDKNVFDYNTNCIPQTKKGKEKFKFRFNDIDNENLDMKEEMFKEILNWNRKNLRSNTKIRFDSAQKHIYLQ